MRTAAFTLTVSFVLAASLGMLASNTTVQPSYEVLMAMPATERQKTLQTMDEPSRLTMFRTHIERWLEANRHRLSASQVALVNEVRERLTPERRDLERHRTLEYRMLCELWRSDVIALSLPLRDQMSSSRLNDVREWLSDCVIAPAIDAVF